MFGWFNKPQAPGARPKKTIIVNEKKCVSACQAMSRQLVVERDMIDQMNWWMHNELPDIISKVMSSPGYTPFTYMFDVHGLPNYRWMRDEKLFELFTKTLENEGFYIIGGYDSDYGRTLIGLRNH